MAENEVQKSKRELFGERLKTKYPDREYADEEALFGQVNDDYDDYERQLGEYRDREGKFEEMLAKDPKNAQFIADMAAGRDPWIVVVERLGIDGITDLMNDPAKKAAYEEANRTYAERLANEKRLEEEYNANIAATQQMREQWDAQFGAKVVDEALAIIDQLTKDAIMGKVSQEAFDMAMKMVNRDADLANARSEGEIAGRNAKVEETLRKPTVGDGLPAMGGSSTAAPVQKRKGFFDDLPERKF